MIDLEIATYWNVETLYYVFNAVAAIMGGNGFSGLLKMIFLFALMIGIFTYAGSKQLELASWFIQALIFVTVLNLPISRVTLTDRAGLEPPRTVDKVPIALSVVAYTTNLTFGWATRTYETVFGVPEALGLQQGDLAFGHRILRKVNKVIIRDPELRADLMQFFKECTLYDVKDGAITPQQIVGATDTWNTIFNNTSPARFTTYRTLSAFPITDTCEHVGVVLSRRVDEGLAAAQAFYGRSAFSRASTDVVASNLFGNSIATSYDWILASSATASDAMKQAMFNNLWREAGAELPALINDTARIQELQTLAGAGQAARQADGSNSTLSLLAQETLPHMRNWIEAVLYALFPLVVVLTVVVTPEGSKKALGSYMMSLAWIGLWPVFFAVINHLSMMHLRHKVAGMALASGVPFQLTDVFDATLADEQAAIGYLVVLVPFLSAALIKASQGGFMSVADKMVSGFTTAGGAAGASTASGNLSVGQTGVDTASVNSTSMHKYDSNVGLAGGGASIGWGNGSTSVMSGNGTVALHQLHNRMRTAFNIEHRSQSEQSQEAHRTQIAGGGQISQYSHGEGSQLSRGVGTDRSAGATQNVGVSASYTKSGAEQGSHSQGQGMTRSHSSRSAFSESAGALDNFMMGGQISGGVGTASAGGTGVGPGAAGAGATAGRGARQGGPGTGAAPGAPPTAAGEKRLVDAMRGGGASKAEIDKAVGNYRQGATESLFRSVTDDFGNEVQIPTGQRAPANGNPGAPSAKGAKGAKAGSPISVGAGINLGANSTKSFGADHSMSREVTAQHSQEEAARIERTLGISGQRTSNQGVTQQSAQNSRQSADASRSTSDSFSKTRDAVFRDEQGVGSKASRSESRGATMSYDFMADPNLLANVAARNGMSTIRFLGQEEGQMMDMLRAYAAERGIVAASKSMPSSGLDGRTLPGSTEDLRKRYATEEKGLPSNVDGMHRKKVAATGYGGTTSLTPDTSVPAIAEATDKLIRGQLDPAAPGSIPDRAKALNENVHTWASPDKEVGAGRANPMAVVEGIEGRDIVDTGKKFFDRASGGDGLVDGEKLNDNKRSETAPSLPVGSPSPKR